MGWGLCTRRQGGKDGGVWIGFEWRIRGPSWFSASLLWAVESKVIGWEKAGLYWELQEWKVWGAGGGCAQGSDARTWIHTVQVVGGSEAVLERNQDLEARKLFLLVPEENRKYLKMCLEACARLYLSRRTISNGKDVIRPDKAPSHSLRALTQTTFPLTQSTDFSLVLCVLIADWWSRQGRYWYSHLLYISWDSAELRVLPRATRFRDKAINFVVPGSRYNRKALLHVCLVGWGKNTDSCRNNKDWTWPKREQAGRLSSPTRWWGGWVSSSNPGIICWSSIFHMTLCLFSSDSTYWTTIIPQTEHSKQKMIAQSQGYICLWWQANSLSYGTRTWISKALRPAPSCHSGAPSWCRPRGSPPVTVDMIYDSRHLALLLARAGCCQVWYVEHFVWGICWPGLKVIPISSEPGGLSQGYFSVRSGLRKSFRLRADIFKG